MPTDPFVAGRIVDEPRQEPNLSPGAHLPAARGWRADRPGDLLDGEQPRGPLFGSPGPNVGYARLLVTYKSADFLLGPGGHLDDAEAVAAELAMKRAASFGRAPVLADIECAALVLGYLGEPEPEFDAWRVSAVEGADHEYETRRAVCDAVPLEALRLAPSALHARLPEIHARLRDAARATGESGVTTPSTP
jgi:hypothetical protein